MKVETWFEGFVARHVERIPRDDWRPPDSEYWNTWRSAFVRHGVMPDIAEESSRQLAEEAPKFPDQQLPALLEKIRMRMRMNAAQADPNHDRGEAERLSFSCSDCAGQGLTYRWVPDRPGPCSQGSTLLYCLCPMGRWLLRSHQANEASRHATNGKLLDLADHPELQGDGNPARYPYGFDHEAAARSTARFPAFLRSLNRIGAIPETTEDDPAF
jgi:hypothetical protein